MASFDEPEPMSDAEVDDRHLQCIIIRPLAAIIQVEVPGQLLKKRRGETIACGKFLLAWPWRVIRMARACTFRTRVIAHCFPISAGRLNHIFLVLAHVPISCSIVTISLRNPGSNPSSTSTMKE